MVAPTRTHIVKIGKSKGVHIPQKMLDRAGLTAEVELAVTSGRIVIQPLPSSRRPRQGWKKSFKKMTAKGDDQLIDAPLLDLTQWDKSDWQW